MTQKLKLFDSHLHIVDDRFPLVTNQVYLPDSFTCEDYLNRMNRYTLYGGAVVSGSFQAIDQSYLIDALKKLGPSFVGVTQLPETVSDEELVTLNDVGVRAVRFTVKRGGSEELRHLDSIAKRIHEVVGWHVEFYVDSKDLADLYHILVKLPAVSIDHLGLSKAGFSTLLKLAEKGVHIKATGFGRVDFNIRDVIGELYSVNPQSLMFGTDHPSTRAARPFDDSDYALVVNTLEPEQAINVLYKNAIDFYKPKKIN